MSDFSKLLMPIDTSISDIRLQTMDRKLAEASRLAQQPTAPGAATAMKDLRHKPPASAQEQEKAAQQFEALLMQEMMKSMWSTVPKDGLISGSREESYYRDMLSEALSDGISKGQGIGIKQVVLREFQRQQSK